MQTFLPYSHYSLSAKVLDVKRLGKQRVEALQILQVLSKGKYYCPECKKTVTHFNEHKTGYHCYDCEMPLKMTAWYNHPAVQMWKGYERGLLLYLQEMCAEWVGRGYNDTCWEKAQQIVFKNGPILLPDWIGNETFHKSHQSNLLRKNPEHYGQYFFGVPDDLPYVWPSKQKI
jgi:ribosomal protein L37AE/L43A